MTAPAPAPASAKTHAALVSVQLMFGAMAVVAKVVMRELPSTGLVGIRAAAAGIVLIAVARATGAWRVIERRHVPLVLLAAATGVVFNQLLYLGGLQRSTATNGVVLGTTIPLFTAAIAILFGREQARLDNVGGLVIAFAGALLVAGAGSFDASHALGNGMIILNCLLYSIFLLATKKLVASYPPATVVAWCFLFGGATLLVVSAPTVAAHAAQLSASTWLGIAFIVLFPTVGTYTLNTYALRHAPASLVAAYVNLQTVVGASLAWVILDERPRLGTWLGTPLIVLGLGLVSGWFRQSERTS